MNGATVGTIAVAGISLTGSILATWQATQATKAKLRAEKHRNAIEGWERQAAWLQTEVERLRQEARAERRQRERLDREVRYLRGLVRTRLGVTPPDFPAIDHDEADPAEED